MEKTVRVGDRINGVKVVAVVTTDAGVRVKLSTGKWLTKIKK